MPPARRLFFCYVELVYDKHAVAHLPPLTMFCAHAMR